MGIAAAAGGVTTYNMIAGQQRLRLYGIDNECVRNSFLSASVADELLRIKGGGNGDIKVFIMGNDNVTVVRNDSYIKTKNPLLNPNFPMSTGDVIGLVNNGGISGTTTYGTWIEIFRSLQV